ncbi:hypothetical protein GO491_06540 [Flavobacteriaceae bacterium Ap0902]|nr:hypothetical protein [Flavobacteriaceae bacterium Ap0902]
MVRFLLLLSVSIFLFNCKKESETIKSKQLEISENEIINYVEYCNDRYDMCFDYPSNFGAQPDPPNGDGKTFINKLDSSKITMYGFIDETGDELEELLSVTGKMLNDEKITKLANGYEITGIQANNNQVYHEKLIVKNSEEGLKVVTGLQFMHPQSKTSKFNGYWESMTEKFK